MKTQEKEVAAQQNSLHPLNSLHIKAGQGNTNGVAASPLANKPTQPLLMVVPDTIRDIRPLPC
jgi:hypothetical protein